MQERIEEVWFNKHSCEMELKILVNNKSLFNQKCKLATKENNDQIDKSILLTSNKSPLSL